MNLKFPSYFVQFIIAGSVSLAGMTAGAWMSWPASVIPPLMSGKLDFTMSPDQVSTMVACLDLGNILSPIPSGYIMKYIGRKSTLVLATLMNITAGVLAILGTGPWYLYVARFLAGLAKGVAFAVAPIYIAEISSVSIRGALGTMFLGAIADGIVFEYIVGPLVSYKTLNYINLSIPLLSIGVLIFVPESPYYLIIKGKKAEATKSLAVLRCTQVCDNKLIEEYNEMETTVQLDLEQKSRFSDLWSTKSNRKALQVISVLYLATRLTGVTTMLAYGPAFLPEDGGGANLQLYLVAFAVIQVVGNYLGSILVDSWGRKPLIIQSSLISCVATSLCAMYYYLEHTHVNVSEIGWIPFAGFIMFGFSFSQGMSIVPSTLVGELFPTNLKGHASAVGATLLALASLAVNKTFLPVMSAYGVHIMFLFYSLAAIFVALFVWLCVFETKGKTFIEIQTILLKKS